MPNQKSTLFLHFYSINDHNHIIASQVCRIEQIFVWKESPERFGVDAQSNACFFQCSNILYLNQIHISWKCVKNYAENMFFQSESHVNGLQAAAIPPMKHTILHSPLVILFRANISHKFFRLINYLLGLDIISS